MASITSATILAITKAATPVIFDLYNSAKGKAKKSLKKWEEQQFPRRLAKKIGNLLLVRTLWRPDDDFSLLKFYYPPKVNSIDSSTEKIANCIEDISNENIIIQGIVGQGKSIFLRWLAIQEIKKDSSRLPVFIELRTLHLRYSLRNAIYKVLESFDITIDEEIFEHLADSGKFVLLLDAFDELEESLTRDTLNEINFLSRRFEKMQIIITSRPSNEIQKVAGFKVMNICPLTPEDYQPFLQKMGIPITKNIEIVNAIKESQGGLANLITTPLMLTLVAIVYESEREIPSTLPEFFERLFQIVLTRHDRLKDGFSRTRHSGLSDRKLQDLFESFCFMAIQNGYGRSLTNEQFTQAFKQAAEYSENCRCEQEQFQMDIVKGACLMLEEGFDIITFLHKSLMEYYAAAFIKHSTDEVAELFYEEAKAYNLWNAVLVFLASIDPYRFSKNYALPQIEQAHNQLIKPLHSRKAADLTKILTYYTKDACMYFKNSNKKENYNIGVYHPITDAKYYTEELNSRIVECVLAHMPFHPTAEKLEQILKHEIDPSVTQYDVPFFLTLEYIGEAPYWEAVNLYEHWLIQQKDSANKTIAMYDKRKDLFLKKIQRKTDPIPK